MNKTKIFIGSSSEGKPLAQAMKEIIEGDAGEFLEPTLWDENVFGENEYYLESLNKALDRFDAAILVFTDDDDLVSRNKEIKSPRDNVVFELGLFLGKLGRKRVFYTAVTNIKTPSDLDGISIPKINWPREDKNEKSAVATSTRNLIRKLSNLSSASEKNEHLHIIAWEGMEDPSLYKNAENLTPREFLLVRGSLEYLPWMTYNHHRITDPSDFIAMVCDIEFLQGYGENERVRNLSNRRNINDLCTKLDSSISYHARQKPDSLKWGVPIRCGFQEILINRRRVKRDFLEKIEEIFDDLDYEYFDIGVCQGSCRKT